MTKQQTLSKIESRVSYLLSHCDDDKETEIVEWVAGHLASEFGVRALTVVDSWGDSPREIVAG